MSHEIRCNLSSSSIQQARNELKKYKESLPDKCRKFALKMAEKGVDVAKIKLSEMNAVYTNELANSIEFVFLGNELYGGKFAIKTDCEYAAFVEFGTGIVGSRNPHPDTSLVSWKYDVNNHGESGWWYTGKDGKSHWTKGVQSRPFMWETANELKNMIEEMGKEVFKEND